MILNNYLCWGNFLSIKLMMIGCLVGRKLCFSVAFTTSVLTLYLFELSVLAGMSSLCEKSGDGYC